MSVNDLPQKMGIQAALYVSENNPREEIRLIEKRESGTQALVEWRGAFCVVDSRRLVEKKINPIGLN